MPNEQKQLGTQYSRALFDVATANDTDKTIEVVFATETPVLRRNWEGEYMEVLDCSNTAVRMQRLQAGAPVLNNHSRYSVADQLGVVQSATFKNKEGRAILRFSNRDDVKPIWQDVKDGILRGISVGYNVYSYTVTENAGTVPTYRATDWEPAEISLAPIPADHNSGTRSQQNTNTVIISKQNNMAHKLTATQQSQITAEVRAVGLPETFGTTLLANEETTVESAREAIIAELSKQRTAEPPAQPAAPAPQPSTENNKPSTQQQRTADESAEIVAAVRAANFDINYAFELLNDNNMTADKARQAILTKMANNTPPAQKPNANAAVVADEQVNERSAVEFALLNRADATGYKIGDDKSAASTLAAKYRGISLLDAARTLLKQRGIEVENHSKQDVYTRSMSTSDFPNVLANIANKVLRAEYENAPMSWKALATQQNLPDFKASTGVQFGGSIIFDEVKEGSEFKYGKFAETTDNWKLSTYGKLVKMTRQMMINDDLGAFARITRRIAQGAAETESNLFWALITGTTKMLDGQNLFHSTHGNLAASGAALSATTMDAARTAMRRQKGLDSNEILNLSPKYIVVAPEQEMAADQLLTNITPNQSGQVNPFTSAGLQKIVEARLPATAWYVFAQLADAFTYGYLDGNEGLYTEMRYGFEVDGVEIKARQDFGVKAWDWRGAYKNPGA